ncbi:hypothetical protein BJ742DRAFT_781471 [Cladochytrium replicatum]|nr:hypothetical protein BJ742DRAFT_781471 [Cladochytrium replicatum]
MSAPDPPKEKLSWAQAIKKNSISANSPTASVAAAAAVANAKSSSSANSSALSTPASSAPNTPLQQQNGSGRTPHQQQHQQQQQQGVQFSASVMRNAPPAARSSKMHFGSLEGSENEQGAGSGAATSSATATTGTPSNNTNSPAVVVPLVRKPGPVKPAVVDPLARTMSAPPKVLPPKPTPPSADEANGKAALVATLQPKAAPAATITPAPAKPPTTPAAPVKPAAPSAAAVAARSIATPTPVPKTAAPPVVPQTLAPPAAAPAAVSASKPSDAPSSATTAQSTPAPPTPVPAQAAAPQQQQQQQQSHQTPVTTTTPARPPPQPVQQQSPHPPAHTHAHPHTQQQPPHPQHHPQQQQHPQQQYQGQPMYNQGMMYQPQYVQAQYGVPPSPQQQGMRRQGGQPGAPQGQQGGYKQQFKPGGAPPPQQQQQGVMPVMYYPPPFSGYMVPGQPMVYYDTNAGGYYMTTQMPPGGYARPPVVPGTAPGASPMQQQQQQQQHSQPQPPQPHFQQPVQASQHPGTPSPQLDRPRPPSATTPSKITIKNPNTGEVVSIRDVGKTTTTASAAAQAAAASLSVSGVAASSTTSTPALAAAVPPKVGGASPVPSAAVVPEKAVGAVAGPPAAAVLVTTTPAATPVKAPGAGIVVGAVTPGKTGALQFRDPKTGAVLDFNKKDGEAKGVEAAPLEESKAVEAKEEKKDEVKEVEKKEEVEVVEGVKKEEVKAVVAVVEEEGKKKEKEVVPVVVQAAIEEVKAVEKPKEAEAQPKAEPEAEVVVVTREAEEEEEKEAVKVPAETKEEVGVGAPIAVRKGSTASVTGTAPKAKKVLTDFENVQYPETVTVKPVKEGSRFRYPREFLVLFQAVVTRAPDEMPSMESIYDDKPASPRPSSSRNSIGPGSGSGSRAVQMSKTGSGGGDSGMRLTSEQRYAMAKSSRSGVIGGVMAGVPPPPGASMGSRTPSGSGKGPRGTAMGRSGSVREPQRGMSAAEENLPPVEPLKHSENAWAPRVGKSRKAGGGGDEDANEEVYRNVRSLLNKLTIEKFNSLANQILRVGITTEEILFGVIGLIFDKALDEPNFGHMYAQLCLFLAKELPGLETWVQSDERSNQFRRALLSKCQMEFESGVKWARDDDEDRAAGVKADEDPVARAEKEYARAKLQRRALGNMMFIGELFKMGMITEKIIHRCIQHLLRSQTDPQEEDLESLCKLVTTVGSLLDHREAKTHVDTYFERIDVLSKSKSLPSRIRFMMLDLIDLRKNEWKARQEAAGPKTIAEIREQVERDREAAEEEARRNASKGGRNGLPRMQDQFRGKGGGGGGGRGPRGSQDGRGSNVGADGFETVGRMGSSAVANKAGDLSQFGKMGDKLGGKGSITLGPQTQGLWKGGARGGKAVADAGAGKDGRSPGASLSRGASASGSNILLADGNEHHDEDRGRATSPARGSEASSKSSTPVSSTARAVTSPARAAEKKSNPAMQDSGKRGDKIAGLIEEYFSLKDVKEVEEVLVDEFESNDVWLQEFVESLLFKVMERKASDVELACKLVSSLIESGVLNGSMVGRSGSDLVRDIEDIAIDVPEVFRHYGMFVGGLVKSGGVGSEELKAMFGELKDSFGEGVGGGGAPRVLGEIRRYAGENASEVRGAAEELFGDEGTVAEWEAKWE